MGKIQEVKKPPHYVQYSVYIPKDVLEAAKMSGGTVVEVRARGKGLIEIKATGGSAS